MKDLRYFRGDNAPNAREQRRDNVVASTLAKNESMGYPSYSFLAINATRKIEVGDELFMCHGSNYVLK